MTPSISVVVASNRAPQLLRMCLSSLEVQCRDHGAEVIVARAGEIRSIDSVRQAFPSVRVVRGPPDATIPRLRGLGMQAATGDVVALTEDHCRAAGGWLEALLEGLAEGADVVGGGMGNARTDRAVDWAAYFSEYGFFSSTRPVDPVEPDRADPPLITGANVLYGPAVLGRVQRWAMEGRWEDVIHRRLYAEGASLLFRPKSRVLQNRTYAVGGFSVDRFQHGLDYARVRLREDSSASRWILAAGSVVLPLVLTARVWRASAGENRFAFLRSLPWTFLFLTAWSMGEMAGYCRGPEAWPEEAGEKESPRRPIG